MTGPSLAAPGTPLPPAAAAPSPAWRRLLVLVLKLALAAGLIGFLIRSGKLDALSFSTLGQRWPDLLLVAAVIYGCCLLSVTRLAILLQAQGMRLPLGNLFSITMACVFLGMFMPGIISGDLVKVYYIERRSQGKAANITAVVLIDRVAGLTGLVLLPALAGPFNHDVIRSNGALFTFYWLSVAAALACLLLLIVGISTSIHLERWTNRLVGSSRIGGFVSRLLAAFAVFRARPRPLIAAVAISIPIQILTCLAFYWSARMLTVPMIPFSWLLVLVPLGLTTYVLPLTPLGIGIGQVAFYSLFETVRAGSGNTGSAIITIYQSAVVLVSLSGALFYLTYSNPGGRGMKLPAAANSTPDTP